MKPAASARPVPPRIAPSWTAQALAIAKKDLAIERASGEIVVTSGFFAVLLAVISSVAFYGGPETTERVAPGVLWLAISFAAVLGLGRTWHREREEGALKGLIVAPLARSAIFAGKMLGVLSFILVIEAVVVPVTAVMYGFDLVHYGPALALISILADVGIAASGTLFGAMTVRTRARDLVLASVLLPLLAPTLACAIAATRELFGGVPLRELVDYFELMGVFDVVFVAGGLGMFGVLVEG